MVNYRNSFIAVLSLWVALLVPVSLVAQTRVAMPKNRYSTQDDVKLGRDAARQVEQQFPLLNDGSVDNYVEDVGRRLVNAIPAQFRHPEFNYTFDVVNASDINAFALPGGPMYVNRGMIEAARNEGEMAGVMAHEIAHVALRHATAQATKQGSWKNQLGIIGLVLGGAVVGGETGAQLGMLGAQAWMTKYSREYETQADILGAQIMAAAGYDPRDLANMFQTIARQGGGRGPEWLSSHPDPGNRYNTINREAAMLRVTDPIKYTQQFARVQERLRSMPPARTMAQIEQQAQRTGGAGNPTAGGRYSRRVELPSRSYRTYTAGNWVRLSVPNNWREFAAGSQVTFAPEGAYGDNGITHGMMMGVTQGNSGDLYRTAQDHIAGLAQANSYLRQESGLQRASLAGRTAYSATLSGRSPITGRDESVTVYVTQLRSGETFWIAMVAPSDESYEYDPAFRAVLNSVRLNA
ncbi:MAG: M48 family metalloprotease [Pyrinomonadaceae bacterium]